MVKNPPASAGRCGFNPWIGKSLWRRKWQPTPVFLPGKSQGSLAGYSPWGHKRVGHNLVTCSVLVQSLSCVQLSATPWTAACQASLSFTTSQSLLTVMSIESMMPSNHLILSCHPLLLLPSIFPSVFPSFNLVTKQQQLERTMLLSPDTKGAHICVLAHRYQGLCDHYLELNKHTRAKKWG